MKMNLVLAIALALLILPGFARASSYQDGDLIFHESRSAQSQAIREATGSRWSHVGLLFRERGQWFVAEGAQPVRLVTLSSFIARGQNGEYRIYRLPGLTEEQKKRLRAEVSKFVGLNYDIYFEWSDKLIYCSELVYKAFRAAAGAEIGTVQKFRDLKLDGPYARELIRRRLADTGRKLDLDEPIVTPVAQLEDPDLVLVEQTDR